MIICLVRHGQTDWNINTLLQGVTDVPLNDTGRMQAKEVGAYLKEYDPEWDLILSSPLSRARETAEIIKESINFEKEIITIPDARERCFGDLEGGELNQAMYDKLEKGHPGVETMEELYSRAKKTILGIVEKYSGNKILLVSHAQFIKAAMNSFDPSFDFRFPLKNSSLNYLQEKDGKINILKYNIVAH